METSSHRTDTTIEPALAETIASRRRHVQLYQWLTRLFTPVYQSDSPVLPIVRDRVVGLLSQLWPATAIQAYPFNAMPASPPLIRQRASVGGV